MERYHHSEEIINKENSWLEWVKDNNPETVAKKLQELEQRALYDSLTGLYNRSGGIERLYEITKSEFSKGKPVVENGTFLFGDLDGLKKLNDIYGHQEGDKFIVFMAEAFKSSLRDQDIKIRWGGDEFVIFLPNCQKENADKCISRIKSAVSIDPRYSITIGVVEWDGRGDPLVLVDYADKQVNLIKHFNLREGQRSSGVKDTIHLEK